MFIYDIEPITYENLSVNTSKFRLRVKVSYLYYGSVGRTVRSRVTDTASIGYIYWEFIKQERMNIRIARDKIFMGFLFRFLKLYDIYFYDISDIIRFTKGNS